MVYCLGRKRAEAKNDALQGCEVQLRTAPLTVKQPVVIDLYMDFFQFFLTRLTITRTSLPIRKKKRLVHGNYTNGLTLHGSSLQ